MKNASVANKGFIAQKCAIRALAERTPDTRAVNKIEGEGVPYPGYFAKCAEAVDCKRVEENSCLKV
jgi:hypothetical protein